MNFLVLTVTAPSDMAAAKTCEAARLLARGTGVRIPRSHDSYVGQPRLVLHWRFPPRGGLDAVLAARVDVRVVSRPHGGAAATVLALSATLSGSTAHLALTGGASAPPALVQDAATALLAGGAAICCRDGGEALAASLSGLLRAVVKAG